MTVGEIVRSTKHENGIVLRSVRDGRTSGAYDALPDGMLDQWTPGFVLKGGRLVIDVDVVAE